VVLESIDMSIDSGTTVLLGPNGAGKSTLLEAVLGLLAIEAGSIEVLGRRHRSLRESRSIWARLGYLPQDFTGPDRQTVKDFMARRAWLKGLDARAALTEAVGLLDAVGLRDRSTDRLGELSGGQRRRVGLAAAHIGAPELVVLDEPTAGLDLVYREQIAGLIAALSRSAGAVLLTTHVPEDFAQTADSGVFFLDGRIAGRFDSEHDSSRNGLVAAYRGTVLGEPATPA
jgi:ABC-2 type transport system ATP-binding protein